MSRPIPLGINGAKGRMGRALQALLQDDGRFILAAAIDASHGWDGSAALEVVVDFSAPIGLDAALAYCETHSVALVTGTTGLDAIQDARLRSAASSIPVFHAANFSLGVAVLTRLLGEAAATLPDWDLEILEAHHAHKTDAPSGTALALGRTAAQARGHDLERVAVRSRDGRTGARIPGTIGFAALRAGDIVGEHTAMLVNRGERLELSHRATDRAIFARGALHAAAWLVDKPPGFYSMADLVAAAP